jgi:hypothetical protein
LGRCSRSRFAVFTVGILLGDDASGFKFIEDEPTRGRQHAFTLVLLVAPEYSVS